MKIREIAACLEEKAPLTIQESYDNCGLLIGDPEQQIRKILLCLDVTPEVMKEAITHECNLIISHHPVIFNGLKKIISGDRTSGIISDAITNGIAIYAVHTNLDNSLDGINGFLMRKLGILSPGVLLPKDGLLLKLSTFCPIAQAEKVRMALFQAGAGQIGNYDQCSFNVTGQGTFRASEHTNPFVGNKHQIHIENELKIEVVFPSYLQNEVISALLTTHPYEEVAYDIFPLRNSSSTIGSGAIGELSNAMKAIDFLSMVREILQIQQIRHSGFIDKPVKKIALCSGAGSFLINEARSAGADIFLTGDLKYHDFFLADDKLILADIGHYESEQWVKECLYDILIEKFPNFAILNSEINTNPVNYY